MNYNDTFYDGIDVELTDLVDGTPRLVHLTFHDSRDDTFHDNRDVEFDDTFHDSHDVEFDKIIGGVARDLTINIIGRDPAGCVVDAEFNSLFYQIGDILCQYYYTEESVEDILYYSTLDITDMIVDRYHITGEGLFYVLHAVEATLRDSVEYRMY